MNNNEEILNNLRLALPYNIHSLGLALAETGYLCFAESINKMPEERFLNSYKEIAGLMPVKLLEWLSSITEYHGDYKTKELIDSIDPSDRGITKRIIYNGFEGVNQSGKSSRINELKKLDNNYQVVRPFLFNGYFNNLVRIIFENTDVSITPEPLSSSLILLAEVYQEGVFGDNIIYDRTPISIAVHQATSLVLNDESRLSKSLDKYYKGVDLLFDFRKLVYMSTPLDVCLDRVRALDRYKNIDNKHIEHFKLMHQSFDKIIFKTNAKVLKLNGNINNIKEDIKRINSFLKN